MEWWRALSVDPNLNAGDYTDIVYMIGGILIATAIIVFGWRVVKDMSFKTIVILVGLIIFIIAFVVPNWE